MKILNQMFLKIIFSSEIFNNWPNDLLRTNIYKTLDLLALLQGINITSVTCKWGTFSPFSFFVILIIVLPSNFRSENFKIYHVLVSSVILFSISFMYILIEIVLPMLSWYILRIILNIWYLNDPSGNSNSSFDVGADILNLLFLYDFFIF